MQGLSRIEIEEAFALYDKKRTGVISLQKLRPLMMSLGIALTEAEFVQVHRDVKGDTFFPAFDRDAFTEVSRRSGDGLDFVTWVRDVD